MKICAINELVKYDFNIRFLNALQQFWRNTKSFQCIDEPKKQNLLLYVNGFTITYTDKNNNTFIAHSGDIVYTPVGSEYKVQISDCESSTSHTIGINFLLFDELGEPAILSDSIEIFHFPSDKIIPMLFQQALVYDAVQPFIRNKIILLEILCALASYKPKKTIPERIIYSLQYLSEHIEENPTIGYLASRCNVSEVYFRKQFKDSLGMTPLEYRNILRLNRAKTYLEYGDISVQEISNMLGYSTVSHFIKEFRVHTGYSPLKYRKQIRNKIFF